MFERVFIVSALTLLLFAAPRHEVLAQATLTLDPAVGATGTLVVVSGAAPEAMLIDPYQRKMLGRFPTGPDPREVALSPDGRFAYITSYGLVPGASERVANTGTDPGPGEAAITVLDIAQRRVHAVFDLGEYSSFESIRIGNKGDRLWMTSSQDGIIEVDAHTGEVKMLWKSGGVDPSTLTLSSDNRKIYVSNTGSDQVTMIDRVTVVPTSMAVGSRPEGLSLSRDGRELWVANSGDNTISVLTARRLKHDATFPSGGIRPTRLRFHPAGREVWVSHAGSREVIVIDVASAGVIGRIPIDGEPRSIAFSSDGLTAYVSVPGSSRVDVLDVARREVVAALEAGQTPTGLAWSEFGQGYRGTGR
jgi:YVTN family beta-propeller protein